MDKEWWIIIYLNFDKTFSIKIFSSQLLILSQSFSVVWFKTSFLSLLTSSGILHLCHPIPEKVYDMDYYWSHILSSLNKMIRTYVISVQSVKRWCNCFVFSVCKCSIYVQPIESSRCNSIFVQPIASKKHGHVISGF